MIKEVMRDVRVERAMHMEVTWRWRRALEKIPSDFKLDSDSERISDRTRKESSGFLLPYDWALVVWNRFLELYSIRTRR